MAIFLPSRMNQMVNAEMAVVVGRHESGLVTSTASFKAALAPESIAGMELMTELAAASAPGTVKPSRIAFASGLDEPKRQSGTWLKRITHAAPHLNPDITCKLTSRQGKATAIQTL